MGGKKSKPAESDVEDIISLTMLYNEDYEEKSFKIKVKDNLTGFEAKLLIEENLGIPDFLQLLYNANHYLIGDNLD